MRRRRSDDGPSARPYAGAVGRTQLESVEVEIAGGGRRVVDVYRSVDVSTNPELAERALSGRLHVLPSGEVLAASFIYHDPVARRFALVLPEALRDMELYERAALLTRLAEDQAHEIPPYVRDFAVVFGPDELEAYLTQPTLAERLEARARELDAREEALRRREEALARRAREGSEREADRRPSRAPKAVVPPKAAAPADPPTEETSRSALLSDPSLDEFDISLSTVDSFVSSVRHADGVERSGDSGLLPVHALKVLEDIEVEEVDEDDFLTNDPGPFAPPAEVASAEGAVVARCIDGAVWIFVRLNGRRPTFLDGGVDVLVQYAPVDGYPVVLLTLVGPALSSPVVGRVALDPADGADRAILEALRSSPDVTVGLVSTDGDVIRTLGCAADRRDNVAKVLDRARGLPSRGHADPEGLKRRALAQAPDVLLEEHPFDRRRPAANARDAADAVALLAEWSQPERLEAALTVLSVPTARVDAAFERILEDAVEHGIALPPRLVQRAIALKLVANAEDLVRRQLTAFHRTAALPERGGLGEEEVALNWQRILDAAAEYVVEVDGGVQRRAEEDIARGRTDGAPPVDLARLPKLASAELVDLLEHPEVRADAALELLSRKDPSVVEAVAAAARSMSRPEVLRVIPAMVPLGGVVAPALVDALRARQTFVRQAAVLALGELSDRRAIEPLVHLLRHEPSDVWEEVARVLGTYGKGAFRALIHALSDLLGPEERFAEALGHLMDHGCEAAIVRLQQDANLYVAQVAAAALARRPAAQLRAQVALGALPPGPKDTTRAFSQRFYQALGRKAPPARQG